MGKKMWGAVFGFVVVTVAGGGVVYLRVHGLSARAKPSAVEEWVARRVRDLATPSSVRNAVNPVRPTELVLAEARDHFADQRSVGFRIAHRRAPALNISSALLKSSRASRRRE